jgi:hypothetical protein
MTLSPYSPWTDHCKSIWWSVHVMKLLIMQSSPASCQFLPLGSKCSTSSLLDPNNLFSTLFSNTLKMEAIWTSEASVSYHNSEDPDMNLHRRKNLKSRFHTRRTKWWLFPPTKNVKR